MRAIITRSICPLARTQIARRLASYDTSSSNSSSSKYNREAYIDPGPQIGEYPNLPWINAQTRPQLGWWDRQMRRNFGEPLHEHDEQFNMWSPTNYPSPGVGTSLKHWAVVVSLAVGGATLIAYTRPEAPVVPRYFPYDGLVEELGGRK
ncbi:hypothetical protein EV182_005522, partial [Spiromyces aspiralis]